MRALASDRTSEDVLRVRWFALFPPNTRRFLRVFKASDLDELALAADQSLKEPGSSSVMAAGPVPSRTASFSSASSRSPSDVTLNSLSRNLADLWFSMATLVSLVRDLPTRLVASMPDGGRSPSRDQSSSAPHRFPGTPRSPGPRLLFALLPLT